MGQRLTIPHRQSAGLCPVNGIRDLIDWRSGRDWSNEFVYRVCHHQLEDAAAFFAHIAAAEAKAYTELSKLVGTTGPPAAA